MIFSLKKFAISKKITTFAVQKYINKLKTIKIMTKKKITYKDVDWELYRDNVEANISNERIWGLGGSEFADDNISALENELDMIDNEEFEELFNMYDIDVWEDYLKC